MRPSRTRVLVTRPVAQAQRWTQALCAHGIDAVALPLMEIVAWPDASDVRRAWQAVPDCAAVMFVSANAVQHFMAARPPGLAVQAQAWGTGPGTQAAVLATGWPAHLVRCPAPETDSLDSEALWRLVEHEARTWADRHVLIVRGADALGQIAGRDWLAQQLQAAGVRVQQCVAYWRRAPVLDAGQQMLARRALQEGHWWLFSSSEAAQNLAMLWPGAIGPSARALATHPRIAQCLHQQGWGRVEVVPTTLAAQVASIECLA